MIDVNGRIHSTEKNVNVVAGANEILDDAKGKKQSVVNQETDASLADRYTKAETYNKTELNNMITTPNQQYVSVTANSQTTSVTDVLPATGAANTIYRVGNWDGSQFDASVYSEYAWNGSSYAHLSTKTQVGEVFDISAYHATGGELAKYADLTAALDSNNGGGVPQSLQKGGMSVKFVHTSDNKYVQCRLMSDSWSIDTSDWSFCGNDVYINNSDFLYVRKDNDGKIIFGIRKNGNIYFGCQIPEQIKQEILRIYSILNNKKVDKDGNKVLSDNNFTDVYKEIVEISNFQQSSDFAKVEVDENGTIVWGITSEGEVYIPKLKLLNNELYSKTTKINGWLWCITNSKGGIVAGIREDGSFYMPKGIPNEVMKLFTELNNSINSHEELNQIFPSLPCIDYGRIVLSKKGDDYCHNPRLITHHHKMYCFYHSATGRTVEDPSANSDRISFVSFNLLNPHYNNYYERGIIADDLNPDYYNNLPVAHVYNITTFISPQDRVVIKYSGNVNGICYQFFKYIDSLDYLYTFNLKYELNGVTKTVPFSNYNYYQMLNELYDYDYDLSAMSSHISMDITDIVKYGDYYYQLVSYPYNYTDLHPRVFLKSSDGINWEPVGIVQNSIYGSNEVSIEIKDDIVYCIDRNDSYQDGQLKEQNGQYFFTFDLNANILTQPVRVSTCPALPKVFKWHNEIFGIYNIPDDYCEDVNRARAQLSKLNEDGTITLIKQFTDYYGFVYPCVIDYGYPVVAYAEMSYFPSTVCLGVLKF